MQHLKKDTNTRSVTGHYLVICTTLAWGAWLAEYNYIFELLQSPSASYYSIYVIY